MDKSKQKSSKDSKPKATSKKPAEELAPTKVKSKKISRWVWMAIAALITASAPIIVALIQKVPASTPPPPGSTPPPGCSIKNLGWQEYITGSLGSKISISPAVQSECEIKIRFDLKASDWAAAYKKLEPNLLSQTHGIRFSYNGTGAANSLEFKLIEKDPSGNETIFFVQWCAATATAEKEISQEIKYKEMACRTTPGSRCNGGKVYIRPELVDRIDFTVSNKPECGDRPGEGEVSIQEIQIIP